MKTKLLSLALVLVLAITVCAVAVSAQDTLPTECPHCHKAVTWSPLDESVADSGSISGGTSAASTKHYYLAFEADSAVWAEKAIPRYVCIYMNGKTLTAKDSRVFNISGGTLSLIGDGTVQGRGFSSAGSNFGGAIRMTSNDTNNGRALNIYGTTVTTTGEEGRTCASGGVVHMAIGTLNIYSGGVIGGAASNGGTVYIDDTATVNLYGGSLGGGTVTAAGGSVYISGGGTLNVEGGEVLAGTSGKNGATVYHGGAAFTMSGGKLQGGESGNAGGAVYVQAGSTLDMSGGKIQGGTATRLGNCVYIPGEAKLALSGSASIEEVKFNSYEPSRLLVKGKVTGKVTFVGTVGQADDGVVIGTSENADTKGASYGIANTEYYVVGKGTDLVISTLGYIEPVTVKTGYCQVCQKTVDWMSCGPEDYEYNSYLYSGHYYVENDETVCNWKPKFIVGNDEVCLDLNGKTIAGTSRAFDIRKGTLNIMDSVGGGKVTACGPTGVETVYGGTFFIRETGALNLYSGTLTYDLPADDRSIVTRGGVIYTLGEVNIYGGEVVDGAAKVGSNIYVDATSDGVGHLGLYGGTVGGNKPLPNDSTTGPCISNRGTVTISGDPQVVEVLQTSSSYTPALGDRVTVEGKFTGSVVVNVPTYTSGMDLGIAVDADLSEGKLLIADDRTATVCAINGQLLAITGTPGALLRKADGTSAAYETAAAAVEAAEKTDLVILLADAEALTVNKLVHLELNGFNVTGATGTGTLACMDNKTNDLTVADGEYGRITNAQCALAGVTAVSPCSQENYVMVTEADGVSFHRVCLEITDAVLRPSCTGIYYLSEFRGDEKVTALVDTLGVALNTSELPCENNMDTTSLYTQVSADRFNNAGTSCLLSNIMKADNGKEVNIANAQTEVYASAYVKLTDGTLLFGSAKTTNLKQQAETIDADWVQMNLTQKRAFVAMYESYTDAIAEGAWTVTNAKSVADRKVLFNNTDYTPYLCPWNYDVVEAAKADGKVHYYFMAGEGLHISDNQTYKDKWGDAFLMVFPNGQTLLVDSGPLAYAPVIAKNLEQMGITHLDAILITHPHSDHHNGMFSDSAVMNIGLLERITVDKVYYRGGYDLTSNDATLISRTCTDLNIPYDIMERGDVLQFGDVKIECLWPLIGAGDAQISGGEEVNNMSITVRVDYGEHSSLLTGDLYLDGEKMILERCDQSLLDVDFLKVPHHGYATSSSVDFINAVSPQVAMAIGRLPIPARISNRYTNLGVTFLDDRTNGYVEVTGAADGTLEYFVSRTEADSTVPDAGDDVVPDGSED